MVAGSTLSSATSRRTEGASPDDVPPLLPAEAEAAFWGGAAVVEAVAAAGAAFAAEGWPSGSIEPTLAPISTVVPSATSILRIPALGAGTILLALSVSSSKRGSPALTASPSALSQRDRIP